MMTIGSIWRPVRRSQTSEHFQQSGHFLWQTCRGYLEYYSFLFNSLYKRKDPRLHS